MKEKRELDDLAIEISELQDEIENQKKAYKKNRLKCNISKIGALSKIGAAFAVVPLSGTLISCACGWNPFKLNDVEVPETIVTTIGRHGETISTHSFSEIEDEDDPYLNVEYYTKWDKTNKGNYSRKKYTYKLLTDTDISELVKLVESGEEITMDRIEELVNKNLITSSVFSKYYSSEREYSSVLDESVDNEDYIMINKKEYDKNKLALRKETFEEHMVNEIFKLLLEIVCALLEIIILKRRTNFFDNQKRKLRENVLYTNVRALERELRAKERLFAEYRYDALKGDDISLEEVDCNMDISKQYKIEQRLC